MSKRPHATTFAFKPAELKNIADDVMRYARELGADDCAVEVSEGSGLSVNVRRGEVETVEHNRDKGVALTVYIGEGLNVKRGNASTSDFSAKALKDSVAAAYAIARHTAVDEGAGLPETGLLQRNPEDFDLFHPWALSAEQAAEIGRRAEAAAFAVSPMVRNSDGAGISAQEGQFVSANSRGFMAGYPYSRHSLSVAPIASARKSSKGMQRDDWYVSMRDPKDLPEPEAVGDYAARRALARLGARQLSTREAPILFEAPLASGLLGAFAQAASGGAIYRKSSFLVDCLGQRVLADHVDIIDDPFIVKGMGSASFDDEGVATQRRTVVARGVLEGYFLSCYSARKLGMQSTGNSGGSHNLIMRSRHTDPSDDFEAMLRKLGTGLLVTELMGQGVNYVTGDYSRGATGFWVENGEIAYPVEEITIAGSLQRMFADIAAVGADTLVRGNKTTGSVLISSMTIAGN
jgi:PmbA protein